MPCQLFAIGFPAASKALDQPASPSRPPFAASDRDAADAPAGGKPPPRPLPLGAHPDRPAADERHPGVVVVVRWHAGIGGAASELAASDALVRDGESADHQTRRAEADATHQQAARRHGGSPDFCVNLLRQSSVHACTVVSIAMSAAQLLPFAVL